MQVGKTNNLRRNNFKQTKKHAKYVNDSKLDLPWENFWGP